MGSEIDLESTDRETRREAVRHVREIRAEASHVGRLLIGPEALLHYRPADDPDASLIAPDGSLTTAYLGPEPGALEPEQRCGRPPEEFDESESG